MKIKLYDNDLEAGCHSSTVAALPDGTVFVVWFQGAFEGSNDVAIMGAHIRGYNDVNISQVVKVNNQAHWNPVISWYNGKLNLFFRVGESPRNWTTWLTTGVIETQHIAGPHLIWSNPQEVVFGPVKNKPIQLSDQWDLSGHKIMLAGDSEESWSDWKCKIHRFTHKHEFLSTVIIPKPKNVGMIQPTLWESEYENKSGVHAIMRTTVGELYRSDSWDGGHSWCIAYGIGLPNNNSGVDIVKRKNGELVMVWNPIYSPAISGLRRGILSLIFSKDNGKTWFEKKHPNLEIGEGEYSYPAMIEDENGMLHITYTLKRKNIVYRIGYYE